MSDISRGEGWWQASDHKWYPPEQHPDFQAPVDPPVPEPVAPSSGNRKWIVAFSVLAVAALALGAVLLLGGDDGNKPIAASSSTGPSSSSASSSSSSVALSEAELQARLITAKDLGSGFTDGSFVRSTADTPCGTQNPDRSIPPSIDVGSTAKTATGISFQQEIAVFDDETTANRAFDLDVGAYSCPQGTILNSSGSDTVVFEPARDHASVLQVDKAVEIDFQSNGFHGQLFFARTNVTVVLIAFISLDTADTSGIRDSLLVTREALDRLA